MDDVKSCFLCDCKSCPNWGIDGYYGLCGERARSDPTDDDESEEYEEDEENEEAAILQKGADL